MPGRRDVRAAVRAFVRPPLQLDAMHRLHPDAEAGMLKAPAAPKWARGSVHQKMVTDDEVVTDVERLVS
jgi:hypothetical protein